ncbi:hypothetical protein LTR37_010900 [Vermiconidia calcicola]|uniref:Uncharacterized protein n=1 Tax=Vermiconidia calcicola TaxID=1690605 RepID=A0ACC3N501_9PEZI|nr:hypothetical protein LTR37_010900 [Vermiconidia calcicola]
MPVWLLVKSSLFGLGLVFFAVIPISHRWPQYRLLVNPLTWLFWKVPTHGQWAIARLQAEAKEQLLQIPHESATDPTGKQMPFIGPVRDSQNGQTGSGRLEPAPERDGSRRPEIGIGRYHGIHAKRHGTLCLGLDGVFFEAHLTGSRKWSLRYSDLKSLRKLASLSSTAADEDILFLDKEDRETRISALKQGDEVFTQIIGYSAIQWQITG